MRWQQPVKLLLFLPGKQGEENLVEIDLLELLFTADITKKGGEPGEVPEQAGI